MDHQHLTNSYMEHGFCFSWEPGLVWLHVASDIVTGIAYYSITIAMLYFAYKRRDLLFYKIFLLFATFILACGTTHFFAAYTVFSPDYWEEGSVKAITAMISAISAILFIPLIPKALALPSLSAALTENTRLNEQLKGKVDELQVAMQRLQAANTELQLSEERFKLAMLGANDGLWDWDLKTDLVYYSPRWKSMLGYADDELENRFDTWERLVHQDDLEFALARVSDFLEGRVPNYEVEFRMWHKDCHYVDILSRGFLAHDDRGEKVRMVGTHVDITERNKLQQQLLQSQKMEAVGTLAGGIAHDFNNILTAIVGYSTLLQVELKLSGKPQEYIDNLMALVERASNLTRGLLAFSRNQTMTPKVINLNEVVTTFTKLVSRLIGENIAVETSLSACPLSIMADCGQIEQVLMNLVTNARDAMPSGGKLIISTDVATLEPGNPLLADSGRPGPYALITVADTGNGMDEATMARIFEPFFTSKEQDKGTGLGLSILYGIIMQHRGLVTVASRPGHGTIFSIHIPLEVAAETADLDKTAPLVAGGTETVLIAEDEPEIRKTTRYMLQQFGYRVLEASDGEEAVKIFRENAAEISLVILDMIMPQKNGKEVFEAMVEVAPDIRTLFISGYPADVVTQRELLPAGATFLPKPVSPMELLSSIRQVLDGQRQGNSHINSDFFGEVV